MYTPAVMGVHETPVGERHEVGVRDLRRELRRWLDAAAAGDEVVVTERGRPIAKIIDLDPESGLERLRRAGLVQMPARPRPRAEKLEPVRARGSVSDLVADQRR
jgi:prevent-host-death family protein